MAFYVYVLKCSDGTYYTGHTDNLDRRIAEHQSGHFEGYTHERRPVELMWSENVSTRLEALERERQIKDWSRKKKEALSQGDFGAVSEAAKASRQRVSTSLDARSNQTAGAFPPPAIVLVRPQLGENIGKAARAMLNFGLTDMRLVAPRDGWPNASALPAASGADRVIEDARVFDTLSEAVADCGEVFATTVRKRGVPKPVLSPAEAASSIHRSPGQSALLFGPERSGLDAEDVALARAIVTVPVNPDFSSLNLAQAVILLAYEWSRGADLAVPTESDRDPAAPQAELDGLVAHLERALEPTGYFYPPDRVPTTKRTLRSILTKPGWSTQEVQALRGVISALQKQGRRPS